MNTLLKFDVVLLPTTDMMLYNNYLFMMVAAFE